MGISLSVDYDLEDVSAQLKLSKKILYCDLFFVKSVVDCYTNFRYPPIIDLNTLSTFIQNAVQGQYRRDLNENESNLILLLWNIFSFQNV
jgi:hypothetical protein